MQTQTQIPNHKKVQDDPLISALGVGAVTVVSWLVYEFGALTIAWWVIGITAVACTVYFAFWLQRKANGGE